MGPRQSGNQVVVLGRLFAPARILCMSSVPAELSAPPNPPLTDFGDFSCTHPCLSLRGGLCHDEDPWAQLGDGLRTMNNTSGSRADAYAATKTASMKTSSGHGLRRQAGKDQNHCLAAGSKAQSNMRAPFAWPSHGQKSIPAPGRWTKGPYWAHKRTGKALDQQATHQQTLGPSPPP